jgi:hypothetical protein
MLSETPEPPGTHEYAWYTWHTNNSGNLLAFLKNFIYYFSGRAEIKGKPLRNINLKNVTVEHATRE